MPRLSRRDAGGTSTGSGPRKGRFLRVADALIANVVRVSGVVLAACFVGVLLTGPAQAHHRSGASPQDGGLVIPALSHGQMRTLTRYRSSVLDLADQQVFTDQTFRRLQDFAAFQHIACLWTVFPGSVSDEASPFNECAHADLAGIRALLVHMLAMPSARAKALALAAEIQRDMLGDQTAWVICGFDQQPFYSNAVVYPRFNALLSYPPTALTLLAALLLPSAAVGLARRRLRGMS